MKNKKHTTKSSGAIYVLAATLLLASGVAQQNSIATPGSESTAAPESAVATAENLSEAFRNVARTVRPSVVRVTSEVEAPFGRASGYGKSPFSKESPFEGFSKGNPKGLPFREPKEQEEERTSGHGTGVIIDSKGYIVTNFHVVDGADTLRVTLHDDRTCVAELIATDAESDLAVIKIDANDLVAARFGDSCLATTRIPGWRQLEVPAGRAVFWLILSFVLVRWSFLGGDWCFRGFWDC